jgi:ABC-2 type transport system permease protein
MALHDIHYQHWDGRHQGIWRRRAVIAEAGLRACLQNKWARYLLGGCWLVALVYVAILFAIGQLLVADSIVVNWAAELGPEIHGFARGLTAWLEQHPEISVRVTQDYLFYWFVTLLAPAGLIAVALTIPHLITRDLGSHAIIVYASKAITRFDYVLGKAGSVLGMLALTWLGPVLAAWTVGNLLAPNWNFFWHSRLALANTLLFVLLAMALLTLVGLGVSAVSSREKATVGLYVVLWLVGNTLVPLGAVTRPWLQQLSFRYDLQQLALRVFRPEHNLTIARDNIPILGKMLGGLRLEDASPWHRREPQPPWPALAVFATLATGIIIIRTKPE